MNEMASNWNLRVNQPGDELEEEHASWRNQDVHRARKHTLGKKWKELGEARG